MSGTETIIALLAQAHTRLGILADPTDSRCSCDGMAREEVQIYIRSWITPQVEAAIKMLLGESVDAEHVELMTHPLEGARHVEDTEPVQNPFSPLRQIHVAKKMLAKVHEARKALDQAVRS